jgi:hypothetical protein
MDDTQQSASAALQLKHVNRGHKSEKFAIVSITDALSGRAEFAASSLFS